MKICLVGHQVREPDEGVRKIAHQLAQELERRHEVLRLSITDARAWTSIRGFQPGVIHYVLSPTVQGLAAAKVLSFAYKPAGTVMSAPHPHLRSLGKIAWLFRPDLVLVQAEDSERRFASLGFRTQFLPNGVDTERFVPVNGRAKERLREKYGIKKDRFVVLHVGSVKRGRNVQLMQTLQRDDNQVLIVGRASEKGGSELADQLGQQGCIVWTDYAPDIQEIYGLSDCYIFPTTDRRYCIEMPLSVLEAMSCNLPVVTTRFGALPRVFEEGEGLVFANGYADLALGLHKVKNGLPSRTRDKVLPYAWDKVVASLHQSYEDILDTR